MDSFNNLMAYIDNAQVNSTIWLIMAGTIIVVLFCILALCNYQRKRFSNALKDETKVNTLGAKYQQLKTECDHEFKHLKSIQAELTRLEPETKELEDIRLDLDEKEKKLAEANKRIEEVYEENNKLRDEARNLENEIADKKSEIARIKTQVGDPDKIKQEVTKLNNELMPLRIEYDKVNSKLKKVADAEVKLTSIESKCRSVEDQVSKLTTNRDSINKDCTLLEKKRDKLKEETEKLQTQRDDALQLLEKNANADAETGQTDIKQVFGDLLSEPSCCRKNQFKESRENISEAELLKKFKESMDSRGTIFNERVINAFHTSLKCQDINPLTVLAGVSGTGKTLLPIQYTKYIGMHSLVMPVQPRWDSSQDLFGFYDYLQKKYNATDLARCLLSFDPYNSQKQEWTENRMLLVLLDEMNLARTEYYFSEFLSKLELRRTISKYDLKNNELRASAEIELDVGANTGVDFNKIWVHKNILFVGTMNEDESTQTLSDKVLDRANVLRFSRPSTKSFAQASISEASSLLSSEQYLEFETWSSWLRNPTTNDKWDNDVNDWINKINDALTTIGRPFGYRVGNAIKQYVANYPGVNSHENYKYAFADQLEQKIIPKLRGIELDDTSSTQCLNTIADIIEKLDDNKLSQSFEDAKESNDLGLFNWHGVTR